jgi:hypothetical protein
VTRQVQTDHEISVVQALLAARGIPPVAIRNGVAGIEADVIATVAGGAEVRVEVGRIMDAEAFERELLSRQAQEDLLIEFCARVRAMGEEPPGVFVAVEFSDGAGRAVRTGVVDAVLRFTAGTDRPVEWTPLTPLPSRVTTLEIKYSESGAKGFIVPSAGAFFPALRELVDRKSAKTYKEKDTVILLAVVPTIQPWMRGPWLDHAVEDVRARRGDSPAPFREIVGLDETTGEVLFTIP